MRTSAFIHSMLQPLNRSQVEAPPEPGVHKLIMRGPYLARVELAARTVATGKQPQQHLAEAVAAYFKSHGYLVSCASDLRIFTSKLEGAAKEWLAKDLSGAAGLETLAARLAAGEPGDGSALGVKELRRAVCALQMVDDLGLPVLGSQEDAVQYASQLMAAYSASQRLYKVRGRGGWCRAGHNQFNACLMLQ